MIINQNSINIVDPTDRRIKIYKYQPSIILIKEEIDNQNKCSFKQVSLCDMVKEIENINPKNSSTRNSNPSKVLKIISETAASISQKLLNQSLETGIFPDNLKLADITRKLLNQSLGTGIFPDNLKLADITRKLLNQSLETGVFPDNLKLADITQKLLNQSLESGIFPGNLRLADITPIFKKRTL